MRGLLIANAGDADPGFVGARFRHHGYAFTECHRERPGEWPGLDGHDLVLLLGSEWSVYWPQVADNVAAETAIVRAAHDAGIPVFGICFGHQTAAHALGGSVHRAATPEIGWSEVESDVPDVIASGPWMQWHYDVVTVPPGGVELARNTVGPQAWRLDRTFCTQFHPEATETMLTSWTREPGAAELTAIGSSSEQLMSDTRRHAPFSRCNAERLVDWFVEESA
ncbi:MAG: type 1 glutamine amidotransferase [Ilumatobacteraceae bacterium]